MDAKSIISKLKSTSYSASTKANIIEKLRHLPEIQRRQIVNQLRIEKIRSDNSDQQDIINDIIQQLDPKK